MVEWELSSFVYCGRGYGLRSLLREKSLSHFVLIVRGLRCLDRLRLEVQGLKPSMSLKRADMNGRE